LVLTGYKRDLSKKDVCDLEENDKSQKLSEDLETEWSKVFKKLIYYKINMYSVTSLDNESKRSSTAA
jgi:hypothetical protein